jgi:hypothetical protein
MRSCRYLILLSLVVFIGGPLRAADERVRIAASGTMSNLVEDLWQLTIDETGAGLLKIVSLRAQQQFSFRVSSADMQRLARAYDAENFWSLPEQITPHTPSLEAPLLTLGVRVGARRRFVTMYDPAAANRTHVRRFMRVWNEVFSCGPRHPSFKF